MTLKYKTNLFYFFSNFFTIIANKTKMKYSFSKEKTCCVNIAFFFVYNFLFLCSCAFLFW